jgi:hypothetical protein
MVDNPEALLREIHRPLKPDGLRLMDPGHLHLQPVLTVTYQTDRVVLG